MRNILKKAAAAVLASALCLSFAGCYDENDSWAAKKGEDSLPLGGYIYYLNSAYSEAMGKVSTEEEVLKATVEDKGAETWIRDRAMTYLKSYFYISDKFDELGLEITEDDQASIQSSTDTMWNYYKTSMESLGIAKTSFDQTYSLYNTKYQKVLETMYGKGGEKEISEDELRTYYTENYSSYDYFYVSLTKKDDDGNSVDMTDDEKADVKKKLEAYVKDINSGSTTIEDAAKEYAKDALGGEDQSTYSAPSPTKTENLSSSIKSALEGAKDNETVFAETDGTYYVVRRLSIAEKFSELLDSETQKNSVIIDMKGEEFADFVDQQAASVEGVEINDKALNTVKLSKLVTDSNKKGTSSETSSAADETSSASSETSSAVSSEAPVSSAASSETE